jgi:hypothetical protein
MIPCAQPANAFHEFTAEHAETAEPFHRNQTTFTVRTNILISGSSDFGMGCFESALSNALAGLAAYRPRALQSGSSPLAARAGAS